MKKLFTLLLTTLLTLATANAKSRETTLWEGSSSGDAEINLSSDKFSEAKVGDAVVISFTFSTAGSMHLCYKTGINGDWNAKTFNGISEWPYFGDTKTTSYSATINATDLTTLQTYGMYVYGFTSSTITKISLISEITPTSETELLSEECSVNWSEKSLSARSDAKIGDVIKVEYRAYKDETTDWPWVQFWFMDANGNDLVPKVGASKQKNTVTTFEYEITDEVVLEKIQSGGLKINGEYFILTSVKLLTYSDSYDAASVTIGSDGIATWSHSKNLDFTGTGITAYYASVVTTGIVTLASTATTWNHCGYILRGSEGTYTVKVVPDANATYPSATYLKGQVSEGTVTASTVGKYHYIFAKDNEDNIAFYKLTAGHTLAAHKAYLETPTDITPTSQGPAPAIHLVFEEENNATALNSSAEANRCVKVIQNGRLLIIKDGITYDLTGNVVR